MKNQNERYVVRDRECGNAIEYITTLEAAKKLIAEYEAEDKRNGEYEEDFYEIYDQVKEEIL